MPVIELDILLGYLVSGDELHGVASAYFSLVLDGKLPKPLVSPFALVELEAGIRSRRILPWGRPAESERDVASYMGTLCEALKLNDINVAPLTCSVLAKAGEIRASYGLTYFDSLHAACALNVDGVIVSTDSDYDEVEGLERLDPRDLIERASRGLGRR